MISEENLDRYGFSCLHHPGVPRIEHGYWTRKIEMISSNNSEIDHYFFKISEEFLIQISENQKITQHDNFEIGQLPGAENRIKLLSERAGWNQTMDDLYSMNRLDPSGIFVASYKYKNHNIPLGSGAAIPVNANMSWIGMILVHPELRRQGIARAMMHTCLSHARLNQKRNIVGLDATPLGKQVYDSLGFQDSFLIWRSILSTNIKNEIDAPCKVIPFELERVTHYLEQKNYTERNGHIEILHKLPGSENFMATSGNSILGFALSRPGRIKPFVGPVIADTWEIAMALIMAILLHWKRRKINDVFIDIPGFHLEDGGLFVRKDHHSNSHRYQIPVNPKRSFMRMYQLISGRQHDNEMDDDSLVQAINSKKETTTFVSKEINEIVPMMYGTSGPEWS